MILKFYLPCFDIHNCENVESDARIEPPIQVEYFRSGGAMILTLMELGAKAVTSSCMRSEMPGYMVLPPDYLWSAVLCL